MITDGEEWHYLAVKSLPALFRRIISNHNGDSYCLNCYHSYSTKDRLKKHEKLCNEHDYCHVEMPKKDEKILKCNHREKPLKVPFIVYFDSECLQKRILFCLSNLEKSYTERKAKHDPSGWAMTVKCLFGETKNKHDCYREIDCIEKLCEKLKNHATEIINYKEKEMIPLTDEENKSYGRQKVCHIWKSFFMMKMRKVNLNYIIKSEIIVITLENIEELLIVFVI